MGEGAMSLSVALITRNEEANIESCLESVRWADEIVIVDSGSSDKTLEKAEAYTSKIYQVPFRDFASQKNEALSRTTADWVFFIDADERVSKELAAAITERAHAKGPAKAYGVKRKTYFFGKPLRFSGAQDDYPIRLFPRGKASFEQPVHESIVTSLPVEKIRAPIIHYSTRNLRHYFSKVTQYVPLELDVLRRKGRGVFLWDPFVQPVGKFVYLYFFKLGILDGIPGFQYAALSSYYTFVKYWKYCFDENNTLTQTTS